MKRIVDIPDEMYDWINNGFPDEDDYMMLWENIRQGIPFEEEIEKIKIEAEENSFKKYNINNEFKCFAIELPILNSIINDHIEELKGGAE